MASGVPSGAIRQEPPSDVGPREGEPIPRRGRRSELAFELGGAVTAGGHFPEDTERRNVEEAIDSAIGLGAWLAPTSAWAVGLTLEHVGLGKDHYSTDPRGQTLNVSYAVDTLWLGARFYFWNERPAFYLGVAAGPALPRVRATGTRESGQLFTEPPQPFECSASGRIGGAVAAAAGVEFDIGDHWSLVGEGRATSHFVGRSAAPFDGCAPGSGVAVGGSLRVGFAYRFGI